MTLSSCIFLHNKSSFVSLYLSASSTSTWWLSFHEDTLFFTFFFFTAWELWVILTSYCLKYTSSRFGLVRSKMSYIWCSFTLIMDGKVISEAISLKVMWFLTDQIALPINSLNSLKNGKKLIRKNLKSLFLLRLLIIWLVYSKNVTIWFLIKVENDDIVLELAN